LENRPGRYRYTFSPICHCLVQLETVQMAMRISLKTILILAGLGVVGPLSVDGALQAASPAKPAISEEASTAVAQMGKTLLADQYSFQARTLRVYADSNGQPLHIAHALKVTLRRPDRLRADVVGDDGSTSLIYDGKTTVLYEVEAKKYATIPVPETIQGMLETVAGRLDVDFPLADFLTDAPDKSFLFGVKSGREVNTVTIDGVPCRHLLFTQAPGMELELWLEKNDRALPRRLIVTYRSQPLQPSFIAELFNWNLSTRPADAEFVFRPPEGAAQIDITAAASAPVAKARGGSR